MNIVVIGGGPAGMMAAISAKENSKEKVNVILLEKMSMLGRKLLITGKGRCNITSSLDMSDVSDFIKNIPGNGMFLYSSFKNYTNKNIIEFLSKEGVKVKEERGNRIFPVSDKSIDVLNAFKKRLKRLNIDVRLNSKVQEILVENNQIKGVKVNGNIIIADKVILATGGKSYPATGSTGDGYEFVKKLGHTIINVRPSLVPFEIYEKNICEDMQGLSLKNVSIKVVDVTKKKNIYEDFGEMLFTHFGVSGPMILSSSAHLLRYKKIDDLLNNKKIKIYIDLKPALTFEKLDARIRKDFAENINKQYKNSLNKLLPQKMIETIIKLSNINPNKKVNEITKEERHNLVNLLKNFEITISKFRPIDEGIVTAGGVKIKEINPSTMESKIINNLYFAGEIIDVDAYTGGFNLQIAYSTGYTAGKSCVE